MSLNRPAALCFALAALGAACAPRTTVRTTQEKFDTTYWNPGPWHYSYWGFRNRWAWPYYEPAYGWTPVVAEVREYTEGSVIVDVIDAATNQLAWRGQGVARVSDDPQEYAKELGRAVDDVVRKFPEARATTVGAR